jgi:hypothetical protein
MHYMFYRCYAADTSMCSSIVVLTAKLTLSTYARAVARSIQYV